MATKKTTRTAAKANHQAADEGIQAKKDGIARDMCPYKDGELRDAWIGGWDGQKKFETSQSSTNDDPGKATDQTGGHDFQDPIVVENEEQLRSVLRDLDDLGVVMSEEQFRQLPDDERRIVRRWIDSRKKGVLSPVPTSVIAFASDDLKREVAVYAADQEELRTVVFPCIYGKPSPTKPEGDPEQHIRIQMKIPVVSVTPIEANLLWGWKRVRIEFGRKKISEWDQREFGEFSDTTDCVADIAGYKRTRTHWIVAFLIESTLISLTQATALWSQDGSARMQPIGEPIETRDDKEERENPEREDKDTGDGKPGLTIFDVTSKSAKEFDSDGDCCQPDEFFVPSHVDKFSAVVSVGQSGQKFYSTVQLTFIDTTNNIYEFDELCPNNKKDGYGSLQDAVIAAVGRAVDIAQASNAPEKVILDLKTHYKDLGDGKAPFPIVK